MSDTLHDPVALGVAGSVTLPLDQYLGRLGGKPERAALLLDEQERITYLSRRLRDALDRPLTNPGSEGLARLVLEYFPDTDLMPPFAEKVLETLRDGESHNRIAVSPEESRVAVLFVAWNGTHREMQSQRFGNYVTPLFMTARRVIDAGIQLTGLLEIDAYVRDNPDPADPGKPLDEVFEIDVEYSYLPGFLAGSSRRSDTPLFNLLMLNPDLCTPEENQLLRQAMARRS